ncbi:hypothetical protein [Aphanothece sacrum]|uniref:hypothetical protein n=1 Tax=Aphanothece sacrum TaxID=1122 RepID=UPI0015621A3F|nr:hypothetical protein [Aphanothece sacrum]
MMTKSLLNQALQWIVNQIAQEVPPNLSVCEFDCNVPVCTQETWLNCSNCKK